LDFVLWLRIADDVVIGPDGDELTGIITVNRDLGALSLPGCQSNGERVRLESVAGLGRRDLGIPDREPKARRP